MDELLTSIVEQKTEYNRLKSQLPLTLDNEKEINYLRLESLRKDIQTKKFTKELGEVNMKMFE